MTVDAGLSTEETGRGKGHRLAMLLGLQDSGRALRDFATYLPTRAIPAIAGFLVLPILARELFPTEIGVLAIDQTLITFGWTIIGSWLAVAIVRELPAHKARDDMAGFERTLRRASWLVLPALGVFSLIMFGIGQVSSAIGLYLPYIIGAAFGLVIQNIAVSLFAASLRPKAYAVVEVAARIGGIGLGVLLVFAGHRVSGYLFGLAFASTVIGTVGLVFAWPRVRGRPKGPVSVRPWLEYGIPTSSGEITLWALAFADRFILAGLMNAGAVGVYSVGAIIGDRMVSIPLLAFITGAYPAIVTAFERKGRAEVERLMRAYTRVVLLIGLAAIAYVGVVSGRLVPALTGRNDYLAAAEVAPVVAIGALFYTLAQLGATGLAVAKHTRPLFYAAAIGLAVNVVANFILIPFFGIMGAAVATPIGTGTFMLAVYMWARQYAVWKFPYRTLVRGCIAAGVGYAVALFTMRFSGGPAADLIASAATGLVAYVATLVLLGERRGGRPSASA